MAIKAILAKLDEVDEKYRDLYAEDQKTKKWVLQAEGLKTDEDVRRLQEAARKEREEHDKTKAQLKTANDSLATFEGIDPEDVAAKLEKLATLEAAGANPKAEEITRLVEAGVAAKMKTETQKLTRDLTKANETITTLTESNKNFQQQTLQRTVDDAVRAAAVGAKLIPEAVPDALIIARSAFKVGADGAVLTEDGRTPDQWLEDRKKAAPYWWPVAQGAGGRPGQQGNGALTGKDNPFTNEGWNMTKQGAILKANPAEAQKLMEAAGVPKDGNGQFKMGTRPEKSAA